MAPNGHTNTEKTGKKMIRAMTEKPLQDAGDDEVAEMVAEYSDWPWIAPEAVTEGAKTVNAIRRLPPSVRAVVATYLGSGELFCKECGETSCIHGYPDY